MSSWADFMATWVSGSLLRGCERAQIPPGFGEVLHPVVAEVDVAASHCSISRDICLVTTS